MREKHPFSWVPSLYLAEAMPYVAVMVISVLMYKRLGVSNTDIGLYTSWLYLPWVIKPFWSPLLDLFYHKRGWIVFMQILIGAGFAGIAFTLPTPFYFQATLAFFWLIAFSSATHDIAADGFYMLALSPKEQALYVGIRSTFYRIATIFGQGLLIMIAGWLEASSGLQTVNITVATSSGIEQKMSEEMALSAVDDTHFIYSDAININTRSKVSQGGLLDSLKKENEINGFTSESVKKTATAVEDELNAFERWIKRSFGEEKKKDGTKAPSWGVAEIRLSEAPGREIILNTILSRGDESIVLAEGSHLVFNDRNWNKPAYIVFKADANLKNETTASFKGTSGNIPMAWSITFFILAGIFVGFSLYHKFVLPKPAADHRVESNFFRTFASFFTKKNILIAVLFMLLFRFPEAQLVKLVNPFLLDSIEQGGLALTTGQVGWIYGTIGMIGLTLGGILGGMAVAKDGFRRWLWPMVLSISLPDLVYVYLSYSQTGNLWLINGSVFVEQFGYGFGFTAYMLYLIQFSRGENSTAHYAICTAFMALGMMLPGMMAGWLEDLIGYRHFFIWVMICCVVTILVSGLIKVEDDKEES